MAAAEASVWPVLATCIGRDLVPSPAQIDRLASRIWRETHPSACPWEEVGLESEQHRVTVAVAEVAAGGSTATALKVEHPVSPDEWDIMHVLGALFASGETAGDQRLGSSNFGVLNYLDDDAFSDSHYAVLAAFRRDLRRFLRFSEKAAEEAGLTAQQYQVLLALRATPDGQLSVGELAEQMLLAPHSASELLSRLEAAGLVTRFKSDIDGRRVDVSISRMGSRIIASLAQSHREELTRLRPMLQGLIDGLDAGDSLMKLDRADQSDA